MKIQSTNSSATKFSSGPSAKLKVKANAEKKKSKRRPSLAELNAEIDASPEAYRRALKENSLRLTGKPNL